MPKAALLALSLAAYHRNWTSESTRLSSASFSLLAGPFNSHSDPPGITGLAGIGFAHSGVRNCACSRFTWVTAGMFGVDKTQRLVTTKWAVMMESLVSA